MTNGQEKHDMITRRRLIQTCCALPLVACLPRMARAQGIPEFSQLRAGYAQRLKKILAAGALPYIDIESSCNSRKLNMDSVAKSMDRLNIGLMALSADIGKDQFKKGVRFDNLSERLLARYPDRFIPVGNGGPAVMEAPDEFLDAQAAAIRRRQIMLLGEFEFRHYPSIRQAKRGAMGRDVHVPINGPVGHRLFSLSERTGLAFQLHYEIEDDLLEPLENMLAQYPKAKVIWCHLAVVRYSERASRYTPAYVNTLVNRFPNLYFDTAFSGPGAIYPLSHQRQARVWASDGNLKPEWRDLIVAHPTRFLSALDLGADRLDRIVEFDQNHRNFLKRLPSETRHQVAYRSAWTLLFNEEFV